MTILLEGASSANEEIGIGAATLSSFVYARINFQVTVGVNP